MLFDVKQVEKGTAEVVPKTMTRRVWEFSLGVWRPAASVVAVAFAALLFWHTINGKNGLSVWQQKRVEDRQLRKDIDELQRDNALLREHNERLKSNPDAVGLVAREKLHYAKPNEVIVALPPEPQKPAQPAGTGR